MTAVGSVASVDRSTRRARRVLPGVVSFAGSDWWVHGRAYANVQVMIELSKERPVLIVNSIGMRTPKPTGQKNFKIRIASKLRSLAKGVRRPMPDRMLWVYTPLFLPAFSSRAQSINARFIALQVQLLSRWIGIRSPSVMVTNPVFHAAAARLHPTSLVYYRSDRHSAAPEIDESLIRHCEDELFEHAHTICYSNDMLRRDETDRHHGKGITVDHGVEVDHFTPDGPRSELAGVRGRVIGFFGLIEPGYVDMPLITELADAFPNDTVVLAGRIATDVTDWQKRPNIMLLGHHPYEALPALSRNFDVALSPMPHNEWNKGVNPLKLKEYLSLGLPVVAVRFPELDRFADVVALAEGHSEFVRMVGEALDGRAVSTASQRRASVLPHSWATRAVVVRDALDRRGRPGSDA
jgi:glycosyltransferase involved in cell wall biosynthesis